MIATDVYNVVDTSEAEFLTLHHLRLACLFFETADEETLMAKINAIPDAMTREAFTDFCKTLIKHYATFDGFMR